MASPDPDDPHTYGINLPTAMVIAAFCGIAWVNTLELQARIFLRFRRYQGLYFWSMLVSTWGCAIHALGFVFLDFLIITQANAVGVLIGVSWWCMVTGQALVLYSRLHLVVRDDRKVRWVLIMIITNFVILHLPIALLSQMAYSPVSNADTWLYVYNVYEKIQMTGFTIQETIISGLYLYEARKILRPGKVFQRKETSDVLKHLIWVNSFVIFLDAALLATEYAGLFSIQTVFKAAVYSIKLRFEFVVLNQLMDVVGNRSTGFSSARGTGTHDTLRSQDHVQLGRVGHRPNQTDHEAHSAFAFPSSSEPGTGQKAGGVMRTTEVFVDTASAREDENIQHDASDVYDGQRIGYAVTSRSRARHTSPASSEEEFAAQGTAPTYSVFPENDSNFRQ